MPDDELYARIEKRFGFPIPREYRLMRERGWMTLDRPASTNKPEPGDDYLWLSSQPGEGYLWMNDMEWNSLEEIATFEFPDYYAPYLPCLVPFAFTGAGDYWCWQTDRADKGMTRVLLCLHDSELATIYAPSFQAALYRQALEFASFDGEGTESGKLYLHRWAVDLALVMPQSWCDTLQSLTLREPVESVQYRRTVKSLLPLEERRAIEQRNLNFPDLDKEIPWANLDS